MSRIRCLLRTQRKKSGLYQKELAALLPRAVHSRVSCVERGLRRPNADEILAYELIFGTLPQDLFPGVVFEVEEAVLKNARKLDARLAKDRSERGMRTRAFIQAIITQAAHRPRRSRL